MEARDLVRFFISNFFILLFGAVLGVFLGLIAQDIIPKAYQTKGEFIVDQLPYTQASQSIDAETERQLVQTLILSIPSREMALAVAKRLGVDPKQIAFTDVDQPLKLNGDVEQANLVVSAVRNSRIGSIQATSNSSEFAAKAVNAVIEELQIYNLLGGKIKNLKLSTEFTKTKADTLLKQLVELSGERSKIEQQKAELEEYLKRGLPIQAFPAFSNDATLNNLKTQLILVKSQYDGVASTSVRGDRLISKKAELDDLTNQINAHAQQLAGALNSQYEIAKTQEANMQGALKETQTQLDDMEQKMARLAQSFGDPNQMKKLALEDKDGPAGPSNIIVVVDRASPREKPIRPKLWLNLALGILLGGGFALGVALLRTLLDNRIRKPANVEDMTGLPCLAAVPKLGLATRRSRSANIFNYKGYPAGLGFLRSHFLVAGSHMGGGQIIGFSPVKVGQRSTKLVAELAILFAQAEKRTLVIDMHMDDPKIASLLGIKIEKGMEAWLTSDDPLREFIDFSAIRELAVLSLARKNPDYDELLSRRPLGAALIELLSDWDYILIDSPSILSDWNLMLALPSGRPLVLTADYSKSTADDIIRSARHASGPRWDVEGVVILDAPRRTL